MPHSATRSEIILQTLRRQHGVATSAELAAALGVSQPTVSRALAPLIQSGQVRRVGAARSQRYLLPRNVPGVGDDVMLMRVNEQGVPAPFGRMVPLHGGACWVDEADGVSQLHDSLPWFLADMRPQGFMGRNFAHTHPELALPNDTRYWSDDDVLRALALCGEDLPGNLVVGSASLERFFALAEQLPRAASEADYPQLAQRALQGTLPGSSAGGEQPKFCCVTGTGAGAGTQGGRSVIVKFSSAGTSPADERTRDLLLCEHLALQVLGDAGLPAARTQAFVRAGRVFLESERFDRHSPWQPDAAGLPPGRIGMVSLLVYDAQYVGEMDTWAATALRMEARGLLLPEDARTLRLLDAYGRLIGNTDRHYGNISLVLVDDDWRLSPTYDMLPMLYMPIAGELVAQDLAVQQMVPTAAMLDVWPQAQALALAFWQVVAQEARISGGFREIAQGHAQALAAVLGNPGNYQNRCVERF
ncbi:MAG: type II toxin-antitoxin system HipA family toxin YjjJ [Simplicispira sp.]|nr:type II toxin-antitoxin system HipA family toxin YjjJ [Simplicispira sp.]